MVPVKAIISAGMPGSGKEEFLEAIRPLDMPYVRMGDVVREEKAARGSAQPTGDFAQAEREAHGGGVWALRTLDRMGTGPVVIDGCRSHAEVEAFRSALGDGLCVIALHSDPATRFQRLQRRAREDAPADMEEFRRRDDREMAWGLARVITLADVMVVNDSTLDEFHRRCLSAVEGVMRG